MGALRHHRANTARRDRAAGAIVGAVAVAALVGCSSAPTLPPTPNLYVGGDADAMEQIAPERRSPRMEILYATDRRPSEAESPQSRFYDERRSDSLAVGTATVRFGDDLEWNELLDASLDPAASRRVGMEIEGVEERLRFPSSVVLPVWSGDKLVDSPEYIADKAEATSALHELLAEQLRDSERKEVFVFVHGVANSFSDGAHRMAQLWHYLGRPGAAVVYTWPANKRAGPLRGYTYARESSEFTVYHLRQFLLAVAASPDVDKIHILAHSRGTGVTLSTLRDLRLLYEHDPDGARDLKLGNIVLAAPDIDMNVAQQRFRPDHVYRIVDRFTIYMTPEDKAINISEFLFGSDVRIGGVDAEALEPGEIEALRSGRVGFDAIEVRTRNKGAYSHGYWIDSPAVLSDVILILRDNRAPGREHGRPLLRSEYGFWEIHDGYPYDGAHAVDKP